MRINFILFFIIFLNTIFSAESVALVIKKKGDVKYKPFASKAKTSELEMSKPLYNQDQVLTGSDGFTKVVYLDDGSTIKVHRESEVYIQGSIKNRKITKQINIVYGKVKFNIKPQNLIDFKVVTPSSVATIKGTRFWVDCNGPSGDVFMGLSGNVTVKNLESGQIVQLGPQTTVNSLPDGTITILPLKPLELQILEKMEVDVGESSEEELNNLMSPIAPSQSQSSNNPSNSSPGSPVEHELIIKLVNAQGDEKELIIKYFE